MWASHSAEQASISSRWWEAGSMSAEEGLLEQSGALEADDELREDPCVLVLAPYNVPMRIHLGVVGSVMGITAGLRNGN
jgi:hypothetical protein